MRTTLIAAAAALSLSACAHAHDAGDADARTRPFADDGPRVYFVNLEDGDVVTAPFRVVFGLSGIGVAPATADFDNTGHHHLLINETLEGEERDFAIPNDDQHLHFGGGQTETVLDLEPGDYTLQLVLGDKGHELHDPAIESAPIRITVR